MNPRIGDTVHYAPHFPTTGECLAAIVIDNTMGDINLYVISPAGDTYTAYPPCDPAANDFIRVHGADGKVVIEDGTYTPGTWHHLH